WLLLLWVLGVFLSWVAFNSMVYAPNGRYFFQANGAIGPLLAVGLLTLIEPRGCQAGGAPRGGAMRSQGSALVWRTAIL
ncbi:hypothetical protein, partial [Klebsiella pneumoniae]|uniref:hypothetical protein n=1 Tax=Klebsiella pneumoniae TaxID=573 RepID=UPI0025A03BD2